MNQGCPPSYEQHMHTTTQHHDIHDTDDRSTYGTIAGIAAVVGPLLLLASTVAYISGGDGMNHGEVGGIVQVWAFVALTVAALGLARRLEPHAHRAAALLALLVVVGGASGVGYGIDSVHVDVAAVESLQDVDSAAAPLALQLPGIVWPIGMVLLGVMLARTGAAPRVFAIALAVGSALFPAARIPDIEAVAVASDVLLAVALVPLGLWLLGGRAPALPDGRRPATA